ncbi:helix-turn-helix domain-containing protein [Nocardia puris]|uniref:Helix-turn-helix protein n=1 Tax=Nocardia puris TaxID=208602 RepID=A0A366E2L6_9NOCA|nr:helix-turn-helix transcriptional regulator [Nocardia puris]MBF6212645.1 helix-turn-helix domain-containing protein [Nocardia puris]MBF6461234.1 helix-turn-helix domain-containing protein [Nocardia puris]RBO96537.1 helix-turn-helix protein [Nocardia puris]
MSAATNIRMVDGDNTPLRELGNFLARKRAAIRPEDVGIPVAPGGKRRTPGLRREEVAFMAGVGLSWYTWIEQGRAENVSASVLDRLAEVLQMTLNERLYLRRLAGLDSKVARPDNLVPVGLLQPYPDSWAAGPAYVVDYTWNVLVVNEAAREILALAPGVNLLASVFEDPAVSGAFTDVPRAQEEWVARFRTHISSYPCDERICSLVQGLSDRNPRFRKLWQRHNIAEDSCGDIHLNTDRGPTLMHWTTLCFTERMGMKFVAYYPLHSESGGEYS